MISDDSWPGRLFLFLRDTDGEHWRGVKVGAGGFGLSGVRGLCGVCKRAGTRKARAAAVGGGGRKAAAQLVTGRRGGG